MIQIFAVIILFNILYQGYAEYKRKNEYESIITGMGYDIIMSMAVTAILAVVLGLLFLIFGVS